MAFLTSLLTLNPEVDRFRLMMEHNVIAEVYTDDNVMDLKRTYFLKVSEHDVEYNIKKKLLEYFETKADGISSEVLIQCYKLLDYLYPSLLNVFDEDDLYVTPYGTIVFDWEKNGDNVFSLEVGANDIGYFIEVDGEDIKQVDKIALEDSREDLLSDLSKFLFG